MMWKCLITTPDGAAVGTAKTKADALHRASSVYIIEHGRPHTQAGPGASAWERFAWPYTVEYFRA